MDAVPPSRRSWPNINSTGKSLDDETEQKLIAALDEFGNAFQASSS